HICVRPRYACHRALKNLSTMLDASAEQQLQVFALTNFTAKVFINSPHISFLHTLQHIVRPGSWEDIYISRLLQGNCQSFANSHVGERIVSPSAKIAD